VNKERKKGKFIVLEGIDGSGLSTQTLRLKDYLLQNYAIKAVLAKEPSEGLIGALIRQILSGRVTGIHDRSLALLFAADRLDHIHNKILPILDKGDFVICDRYLWSSFAYQGLTNELVWIEEINKYALKPDLTIFIRVRPETSMQRICSSRIKTEIFETRETLEKVLANYEKIFKKWQECGKNVVEIDGEKDPQSVQIDIMRSIDEFLQRME